MRRSPTLASGDGPKTMAAKSRSAANGVRHRPDPELKRQLIAGRPHVRELVGSMSEARQVLEDVPD